MIVRVLSSSTSLILAFSSFFFFFNLLPSSWESLSSISLESIKLPNEDKIACATIFRQETNLELYNLVLNLL